MIERRDEGPLVKAEAEACEGPRATAGGGGVEACGGPQGPNSGPTDWPGSTGGRLVIGGTMMIERQDEGSLVKAEAQACEGGVEAWAVALGGDAIDRIGEEQDSAAAAGDGHP